MIDSQKIELIKGKRDMMMDGGGLIVFTIMVYLVLNPHVYDAITNAINRRINSITYRVSVWQTRLAIRSLPETDDS